MSMRARAQCGDDSNGTAAAAQFDNPVAGARFQNIKKRFGTVIKSAISEHTGPRNEWNVLALPQLGRKGDFMAAAFSLTIPCRPERCTRLADGKRHLAKHLLHERRVELVFVHRREYHQ